MKTVIFFFTGTGSSLAAAKTIAKNIPDCDIKSISTCNPSNFNCKGYGRIGFIFPNYYGSIPNLMKLFIKNLLIPADTYCFAIVSAGGTVAMSLADLSELLKAKKLVLDYSGYISNGSNYIVAFYYNLLNRKGNALKNSVIKNSNILYQMSKDIYNLKKNNPPRHKIGVLFPTLFYGKKLTNNRLNIANKFSVSESCNGCEICSKICPANNINMSQNKTPEWNCKCEDCCGCIQACPQKAILYKGKYLNKNRYFHPETSIVEVISHNLH